MKRRRLGAVLAILAILAIMLAACSNGSKSGGITLVLYSGQHPQTTTSLVTAFEAKTGINVEVRDDDEDVLAQQLVSEGSRSPADLIFTENTPALEFLQEKGLLAPVESSTLAHVPSIYNSPQHDFVGVSARVSVLIYNTNRLKASQLPTSVMQLAEPKWKGLLAIAPAETDFQPIITAITRAHGQAAALAWLKAIKTNGADNVYPDNETISSMVNNGTAAIGIINHYYWYRLQAQIGAASMHSKIAFFAAGDPGYVIDVSGAAILKSTHHLQAAEEFLAFLVSAQGQEILAHSDSFEYPIGSGVKTAQPLPPFAALKPYPISIAELGDGSQAVSLMRQAQLIA